MDIDIEDNGDGTVNIYYTVADAGDYTLNIKFGGQPVPEGFYTFTVSHHFLFTLFLSISTDSFSSSFSKISNGFKNYLTRFYLAWLE